MNGLLVAGTTSDAGKSVVTTGLCRRGFVPAPDTSFAEFREQRIDRLTDAIDDHLDVPALCELLTGGAPPGLPFVPPGGPSFDHVRQG